MNLGEKIILLRKQKGITQEKLAEVINVTRQTISKWELNQSTPDLEYLAAISEYFGVTTDYLILPLTLSIVDLRYSGSFICTIAIFAAVQECYLIRTENQLIKKQ